MKNFPVIFHAVLLCICLVLPNISRAQDSITWMEADAPPFFIHRGELKGQGYEDLITEIIKEQLPQYDHQSVIANVARHYYNFKHGEKVCTVGFFKTPEREEFAYFSIPSMFTLPVVLIIQKDNFERFGAKRVVDLEELLASGDVVFGVARDRSYGKDIDEILEPYKGRKNMKILSRQQLTRPLFKMLLAGRVDVLLGLPEEAMYMAEQEGARDKIMTLTIRENQKGFNGWLSYLACSRNEWGKKVIEDMNRVLLEKRPSDRYRGAYERWLDDSSLENFRKLYKEIFLKITR